MDAPITDPTLSIYHAPLTEHERVYFASYLDDDTGDTRLLKVTSPAAERPAALIVDAVDSEQGDG